MGMRKWHSPRMVIHRSGDERRARRLVRKARIFAGYLLDQLSGNQTYRWQQWTMRDGSTIEVFVWRDVLGDRAVANIDASGKGSVTYIGFPFFALVWYPEGLLVTPRSEDAPYGYGFPKRDRFTGERINAPYGTVIAAEEDVALNQVLFNKFENNKYLDKPGFISGIAAPPNFEWPDNPRLRDSLESPLPDVQLAPYVSWALGYTPVLPPKFDRKFWEADGGKVVGETTQLYNIFCVDEPGLNMFVPKYLIRRPAVPAKTITIDDLVYADLRQSVDLKPVIYEAESEQWFAHWPEELLYENVAFETIFQETNLLRDAVGEKPITRPVRGFANGADRTTVEMSISGKMFHNTDTYYRQGYGKLLSRVGAVRSNITIVGENLEVNSKGSLESKKTGEDVTLWWRNSPPHYDNMVTSEWSTPSGATALNLGGGYPVSLTESGPPYPNIYDPPAAGYSYAQWFEKRSLWVVGGLFVNDTPYGAVSVRSIPGYLNNGSNDAFAFRLFMFGRSFAVGQIYESWKDPAATTTLTIIGATAFKKDNQLWLRAVAFAAGEAPGLHSYITPIANSDSVFQWQEEAFIALDSSFRLASGFCFSFDGMQGTVNISIYGGREPAFAFPAFGEPHRQPFTPYTVYFNNGAFSIEPVSHVPNITFTVKTENVEEITRVVSYEQKVLGSVSLQTFYVGDELKTVEYHTDMHAFQHWINGSTFRCVDYISMPSGKTIPVVQQTLVNGQPQGACFIVSFLYFDPRTENVVYAKINLRRDGATVYGILQFYFNDIFLKEYPEQVMATHYHTNEPKISCFWSTEAGPDNPTYVDYVYDAAFLRDADIYGNIYPLPYPMPSEQQWMCTTNPYIYYRPGAVITGQYPVSVGRRSTCLYGCYSKYQGGGRYTAWSYQIGVPNVSYGSRDNEVVDTAVCEFAQYKDRIALDIYFRKIAKIQSEDPEGDHILYTNFEIEKELGMGALTSLIPLGVV